MTKYETICPHCKKAIVVEIPHLQTVRLPSTLVRKRRERALNNRGPLSLHRDLSKGIYKKLTGLPKPPESIRPPKSIRPLSNDTKV